MNYTTDPQFRASASSISRGRAFGCHRREVLDDSMQVARSVVCGFVCWISSCNGYPMYWQDMVQLFLAHFEEWVEELTMG